MEFGISMWGCPVLENTQAVRSDWKALEFASAALKADKPTVIAALAKGW